MKPRWDIAAVAIAVAVVIAVIPLTMSPLTARLITLVFSLIIRKIWPATAQCERLEWVDIPDGILHECKIPIDNCMNFQNGKSNG